MERFLNEKKIGTVFPKNESFILDNWLAKPLPNSEHECYTKDNVYCDGS